MINQCISYSISLSRLGVNQGHDLDWNESVLVPCPCAMVVLPTSIVMVPEELESMYE